MRTNYNNRLSLLVFIVLALGLSAIPGANAFFGWFETYFHEISHGMTAALTGGSALQLQLRLDGSGTMWTSGGVRVLVAFAGYAGAAVWGSMLYVAASRAGNNSRWIAGLVGGSALWCLIFHISWMDPVSLSICCCIAAVAVLAFTDWGAAISRPALRLVGAYVMVSAARSPTYILATGIGHSDATDLTEMLLLPELFWVGAWVVLALVAVAAAWMVEAAADRSSVASASDPRMRDAIRSK